MSARGRKSTMSIDVKIDAAKCLGYTRRLSFRGINFLEVDINAIDILGIDIYI